MQHTSTHATCSTKHTTAAIHCNTMQHTSTPYNTLQHTATYLQARTMQHDAHNRCTALQHTALQHTATPCNTLQHPAAHLHAHTSTQPLHPTAMQYPLTPCTTLQHPATPCNTLQRTSTHALCSATHTSTAPADSQHHRQQPHARAQSRYYVSTRAPTSVAAACCIVTPANG